MNFPKTCGFEDVVKNPAGEYVCSKCGKNLGKVFGEYVKATNPNLYRRLERRQVQERAR